MKMPKKKGFSIGKDVLSKAKKITPSKAELTIKAPPPFDLLQLKLKWEKEEKRQISEEEFKRRFEQYKKRFQEKQRRKFKSQRKAKPYV